MQVEILSLGLFGGIVLSAAFIGTYYYRKLQKQIKKQSFQLGTIEQLYNEVQLASRTIDGNVMASIQSLIHALEARDSYTRGHSERVNRYSMVIGKNLGLTSRDLQILHDASLLHDIGKIGVYDRILLKPMNLTPEEFALMKSHPELAKDILKHLPFLEEHLPLIEHHHERQDGSGYPLGLKGEEIPLGARIIQVADSWDAMTSDRPYRRRLSTEVAVQELIKGRGTQLDKKCVDAFIDWLKASHKIPITADTFLN